MDMLQKEQAQMSVALPPDGQAQPFRLPEGTIEFPGDLAVCLSKEIYVIAKVDGEVEVSPMYGDVYKTVGTRVCLIGYREEYGREHVDGQVRICDVNAMPYAQMVPYPEENLEPLEVWEMEGSQE
jgi:hypothetical protein